MGASKEEIRKAYEEGKGTFKKLSEMYEVSESTIKSWAKRDKDSEQPWVKCNSKKVATKSTKVATNKKVEEIKKEVGLIEVESVLKNTELNDRQKLFCIYYVKYFNTVKAAMKAGYSKDYSYSRGYELLEHVGIKAEIQRLKANKFKGAFLSKEDLLQKYIDIAFADITDFIEFGQEEIEATNPETGEKITYIRNHVYFKNDYEVDGTMISEVSQGKDGVKIKLQDKMKALEFLAKNIGLLDIETQQRLHIEKEKLELAKSKADKDNEDDKPIEILIRRKGEGK